MGLDFQDRFWDSQIDLESAARFNDFREGIRFALSLMLELL